MSAPTRMPWTAAEYHAFPAVSRSQIVTVLDRPELYAARYEARTLGDEEGAALRFGRLFHLRVVEPGRWEREVAVQPADLDARTKAGKAWLADVEAEGREVLSAGDAALIDAMRASLLRTPAAGDITRRLVQAALRKGDAEVGWRWTDHVTGLECKALHDLFVQGEWIVDRKTTTRTDPDGIAWACRDFAYHLQAAWYSEPLRLLGHDPKFILVFVMKAPPHEVVAVRFDEEMLARGREGCRRGLDEIATRRRSQDWRAPWSLRPIIVGAKGWTT